MRSPKTGFVWVASILSLLFCAMGANARVTRVEIISRSDIQDGRSFGLAGAYEKIVGRVYFAVDPANIHNRQIVDLDKAPRNAQGEVEFYADLYLLRPKDMDKGNGAVLFEVSNRGGKGILHIVNGVTSSDPKAEFGDGFLMRQGYTVAWVGWEADLAETRRPPSPFCSRRSRSGWKNNSWPGAFRLHARAKTRGHASRPFSSRTNRRKKLSRR